MDVERLDKIPAIDPSLPVKYTEMGNVLEVQYMSHRNMQPRIRMLPGGDRYIILATGEVKECEHHGTRKGNICGIRKTFARCRELINTNVTNVENVRWCTLTYAENMMDTERLYEDFRKFNQKFQYYCKKNEYGKPEYIVMMEPQGRGAWHAHLLYIWQSKAPYIPNDEFSKMWGHGFTKIKKLDNVDNVGAYLTAYLGDMEIENHGDIEGNQSVKKVEMAIDGKKQTKYFLKGARLHLYPAGFKMIRHSKGIKEPIKELVPQEVARKKVLGATKTFESAVKISDTTTKFESVIIRTQYNRLRKKEQAK